MNLAEMVKNVNVECHPVTNVNSSIKRWLNQGQKIIASKGPSHGWFWLRQFDYTFPTTADISEYALSPLVDISKVVQLRDESTPRLITNMTDQYFRTFEPGPTSTGESFIYRLVGFAPVQYQPVASSTLAFVSDSATDSQEIRIQGLNASSVFIQDTVTLTGITPATSVASFVKVMSLSKSDVTTGSVTVTSDAGATTNVVLAPSARSVSHPIIKLHNIPDDTKSITYDFIMKMTDIVDDNDISLVPEQYHDAIELYATARCYKHLNNPTMWQSALGEFQARLNDMTSDNTQPSGVWGLSSFDSEGLAEAVLPSNFPRGS